MKIASARIGAALVVSVGAVAVSTATLATSLSAGSALTVGSMAGYVRLAGDVTLASDLKRMSAADRSLALSQHGLVSEAALSARMAATRERILGDADRQVHFERVAIGASGFLCVSLIVLALISLRVAAILRGHRPARGDTVRA